MHITVNGEKTDVPDGQSVAGVLQRRGHDPAHCAVEVNRQLCRRSKHAETKLSDGDVVEIVTLVGGG
ncbi:MAG: sulfur carrier protein ThiS [Planctomycetes bacterium]|jgi:sulfur carrier protein|nr:sulfur carrier protein ThiS [Planctomycetota bacterium]